MAITDYRLEAWTLPSSATFEKVVASVPWESFTFGREINGIPHGTVALSAGFDRIKNMIDPATNTETLLRCFKRDGTEIGNCIIRDGFKEFRDNTSFTMTGPGIEEELEFSIIYPYDWVNDTTEVKQPDWIWGGENTFLRDPGFEGLESESTSWESGDLEGWEATPNSGINWEAPDDVTVLENATEARTGDWVIQVNADTYHSGIRKRFEVEPGTRVTASVWVRSPTTGKRITAGITVKSGYTIHHTNGFYYSGFALAELGNVARNPAGNGLPGGSTDGTWQQINLDVTIGTSQTDFLVVVYYDHHDGLDGPIFYIDDFDISGGSIGFESWEPRNSTLTLEETSPIRSGAASLQVVTQGTGVDADGLAQPGIEGLEVGVSYTLGFWVYHTEGIAIDFKAVFRAEGSGNWYSSSLVSVPDSTWTFVSDTWVATQPKVRAELRVSNAAARTFWVDDTVLAEGFVWTTLGNIVSTLLVPIQARGSLDWLKVDSWSTTVDSNGVTWANTEVSVRVNRGRSMLQTLQLLQDFGMEWEVVWNAGSSQYELKIYDGSGSLQGMGADRTSDPDGKLHAGGGLVSARVLFGSPGPNRFLAEGEDLLFGEEFNATLETAYGRREGYAGNLSYMKNPHDVADHFLQREYRRFEVRATLKDIPDQEVYDKYALGDLFNVDLQPDLNEALRVHSMQIVATKDMDSPTTSISFRRASVT